MKTVMSCSMRRGNGKTTIFMGSPWRCTLQVPLKRRYPSIGLHNVTCQMIFAITTVKSPYYKISVLNLSPCNKDVTANAEKLHTSSNRHEKKWTFACASRKSVERPIGSPGRSGRGKEKHPFLWKIELQFSDRSTRTLVTILSYPAFWYHGLHSQNKFYETRINVPCVGPRNYQINSEQHKFKNGKNYICGLITTCTWIKSFSTRCCLLTLYPATVTTQAQANSAFNIPTRFGLTLQKTEFLWTTCFNIS